MLVYVAGKFEEKTQVRLVQQLLRDAGHEISCDWTVEDETGKEGDELTAYRYQYAEADYHGVADADIVVVLNHPQGFGLATEFGIALALGKAIIVVDPEARTNVFYHLAQNPMWAITPVADVSTALAVVAELAHDRKLRESL